MSTVFCSSCGAKHEYSGFAPNFCSKCGSPMNPKALQAQANKFAPQKVSEPEPEEDSEYSEDSTDINSLPNLKKLDVEISIDGGFRSFDLEELSRSPSTAKLKNFKPIRRNDISDLSPQKYKALKDEDKN